MEPPVQQAKALLVRLNERRSEEGLADDLLLFLYRLKDSYRIVRSRTPLVRGKSISFLNDIVYRLESNPDAALSDDDVLEVLRSVLEGIVKGTILVAP